MDKQKVDKTFYNITRLIKHSKLETFEQHIELLGLTEEEKSYFWGLFELSAGMSTEKYKLCVG